MTNLYECLSLSRVYTPLSICVASNLHLWCEVYENKEQELPFEQYISSRFDKDGSIDWVFIIPYYRLSIV